MKRASITTVKNQLSALLDRVRHGETVIIEDRGLSVAGMALALRRNCDPFKAPTHFRLVLRTINPAVLVEVLSPSTIDYDLGEKCARYKQIPTTRAIVHVWQDQRRIAIHARTDGRWHTRVFGPGETASVDALGCRIDVDTLYTDAGGP